jgi:pseudouridine-5'-phosphate glycosidase
MYVIFYGLNVACQLAYSFRTPLMNLLNFTQGAVPATIAIIKGRIKVGLDQETLAEFASLKTPAVKTSRRDFPYVLSKVGD